MSVPWDALQGEVDDFAEQVLTPLGSERWVATGAEPRLQISLFVQSTAATACREPRGNMSQHVNSGQGTVNLLKGKLLAISESASELFKVEHNVDPTGAV